MRVRRTNLADRFELRSVEPKCREGTAFEPDGREDTAFRRNVEAAPLRIPGQDVWRSADLVLADHTHRAKVEHLEQRVALRADERKPIRLVERKSMRMIRSWEIITLNDLFRNGIDGDELIARLDGDENAARHGIVLRVTRLAAERNGRAFRASCCVDDDVGVASFIGNEDFAGVRGERDAV